MICSNDIAHAANMGVVEEGDNGGLTGSTNLLGLVCTLFVGSRLMPIVG